VHFNTYSQQTVPHSQQLSAPSNKPHMHSRHPDRPSLPVPPSKPHPHSRHPDRPSWSASRATTVQQPYSSTSAAAAASAESAALLLRAHTLAGHVMSVSLWTVPVERKFEAGYYGYQMHSFYVMCVSFRMVPVERKQGRVLWLSNAFLLTQMVPNMYYGYHVCSLSHGWLSNASFLTRIAQA